MPKRAIIRVILEDVDDAQTLEIKKQIEELVKSLEKVEVEVTMLSR